MSVFSRKRGRALDLGQISLVPAKRVCSNGQSNHAKRTCHQMDEFLPQSMAKRVCYNNNIEMDVTVAEQDSSYEDSIRKVLMEELPLLSNLPANQLSDDIQSLYDILHKPRQENIHQDVSPAECMAAVSKGSTAEQGLFTLNDVRRINEVLLKQHEERLVDKFQTIMVTEMAHQYDVYVKFTYDQIQQRYNDVPTYMS